MIWNCKNIVFISERRVDSDCKVIKKPLMTETDTNYTVATP